MSKIQTALCIDCPNEETHFETTCNLRRPVMSAREQILNLVEHYDQGRYSKEEYLARLAQIYDQLVKKGSKHE